MKNRKFWWALIVFLVAWSIWEIYPPTNQPLLPVFKQDAQHTDATFNKIVEQAQALNAKDPAPQHEFAHLREAIGTNDIQPYFAFNVKTERNPTDAILNRIQREASGKIKLGLDLQGGSQFLVSLQTNRVVESDTNQNAVVYKDTERQRLVTQAIEVLRKRVDRLGVAEPVLQPSGANHILIQLPGLSEEQQKTAKENIEKAAYLEFRMVHPDSAQLIKEGIVEPGYEKLDEVSTDRNGNKMKEPMLVEKRLANGLTGKYIKRAVVNRDPTTGDPEIDFVFDSVGAEKFGKLTTDNVGHKLAIVLDGELKCAPVIQTPIVGGSGKITLGNSDYAEAQSIANVLENPLETPVHIDEVRSVDPTLGKDTVHSGMLAAILGTLFVAVFMIVYYHRCGLFATIAMIVNLVILLGVMCSIGTTLTLPGIAGIVLTVGMAVDANVLIYERLREEMATGKSLRGAIAAAYDRAFGTIFDSHTTTLISAIILIYMGTGSVKGFGVTLTIGVALSLFTALVVTRLIFDFLFDRGWVKKIGMLHIIKNPHWDFMRWALPAFITSWLIIFVGMGWGIHRGHNVMGIDFAGGDAMTLSFNQKVDVDQIRKVVEPIAGESQIQYQKGSAQDMLEVVTQGKSAEVEQALVKQFPNAGFHVIGRDHVGGSVGVEIQKSAVIASFLSLFGILIYVAFRYEFSFSVGAVVAVVHDVLMTLGIFFISGRQLSAPMVAAVLTIIGFSINDTIVIFDRIREDLKLGVRGTFKEVMNKALNQTLSRTIITSGTVFLSTMALYLFGGGAINDFAFTFLVGIITGTYSSIYIASALVLWWHKGERPKAAATITMPDAPDAREERVRAGA